MLINGLSQVSFTQCVNGRNDPSYKPNLWRGNFSIDLEVDSIKICYEDTGSSMEENTDFEQDDRGSESTESSSRSDEVQSAQSHGSSVHDGALDSSFVSSQSSIVGTDIIELSGFSGIPRQIL